MSKNTTSRNLGCEKILGNSLKEEKTALITGGAKRLGRSISKELARAGYNVKSSGTAAGMWRLVETDFADILITDEVLAVADLEFRKKSLERLNQISAEGKTIIFVSHNLNSVKKLCDKGILLDKGTILLKDKIENVLSEYIALNKKRIIYSKNHPKDNHIDSIKVIGVDIINHNKNLEDVFHVNEKIGINITFEVKKQISDTFTEIELLSSSKIHIFSSIDKNHSIFDKVGIMSRTVWIGPNILNKGLYFININLLSSIGDKIKRFLVIDNAASFETIFPNNGTTLKNTFPDKREGLIAPKLTWTS